MRISQGGPGLQLLTILGLEAVAVLAPLLGVVREEVLVAGEAVATPRGPLVGLVAVCAELMVRMVVEAADLG
jgi:hypothetical protein